MLPCEEYDATTKTLRNNNGPALALLEELNYAAFAITSEGYFRMSVADFSQPRQIRDFLLLPQELVSKDVLFLAWESLAEILAA
jgi:hypothetical protein